VRRSGVEKDGRGEGLRIDVSPGFLGSLTGFSLIYNSNSVDG
jgi:hypothetical protein